MNKEKNSNPTNRKKVSNEMSVMDILMILLRKWWVILAVGIVFALAGYLYTTTTSVPVYKSNASLYIDTKKDQVGDNSDATAILYAQDLMPTYIELLESRSFIAGVEDTMENKYDYDEIMSMTKLYQVDETNILTIEITSLDKYDSYLVCKNMVNYAKDEILRVFEDGNVKIIDLPSPEPTTVIPSASERAIVMFVLGAILALAVLVIYNMFDNRIATSEELTEKYGIPVLGEVPSLSEKA